MRCFLILELMNIQRFISPSLWDLLIRLLHKKCTFLPFCRVFSHGRSRWNKMTFQILCSIFFFFSYLTFKRGWNVQTAFTPGRGPILLQARTIPDVIWQIQFGLQCIQMQERVVYFHALLLIALFLSSFSSLFVLSAVSQVAQWPEKEEEEQPMFGEEYDWWVTNSWCLLSKAALKWRLRNTPLF